MRTKICFPKGKTNLRGLISVLKKIILRSDRLNSDYFYKIVFWPPLKRNPLL